MALLRDWTFVEEATRIPALRDVVRDALIRAVFTRDDRVLPRNIIADLSRAPAVTVKVKDDGEVRKLVQVLNGSESSLNLGLGAEDYHYFRRGLGVGKDRDIGVVPRPRALLTYDWLVPEPRGVQLDFSAYRGIDLEDGAARAVAQVGATWKDVYDAALTKGRLLPIVPTVPLDFALGDAIWGDAPLGSFLGEFGDHVQALRTISAFGHRSRLGFEDVSVEGTGYDLVHGLLPLADEFVVPIEIAIRLGPKPPARKTLTYSYDDGPKAAAALDKLARSGRTPAWVHVADGAAARALRPRLPAEAFTVQVSIGGPEAGIANREKAMDAALAGFKGKAADVPNPFDGPSDEYRKAADRIGRSAFVGEVRLPARLLGDFHGKLAAFGQAVTAPAGLFASLRASGTCSAFPSFETSKERHRLYDLSKGVADIAAQVPGTVFVSRIAHLWADDPDYRRRMDLLRRLKLEIDAPHVIQPFVVP
jgi:FAD/FMN-containing dehydrogenase